MNALPGTCFGRISGHNVLAGLVERGDGRRIRVVLRPGDLRDSTAVAGTMELADHFVTIDEYFDCTAGVVPDHGGEVPKFIGDTGRR